MNNLTERLKIDPNDKLKDCKKGDIIQFAGNHKTSTFYVKKGLLSSYIIDGKGKEHILCLLQKAKFPANLSLFHLLM